MKPTPQVIDQKHVRRSFPLTDYSFHSTVEAQASSAPVCSEKKLRAPWKLSSEFLGAETRVNYVAELLFFIIISAISAWPIILTLHAITRMVRNY